MALVLPIKPVTKPSTLNGLTNGQLPVAILALIGIGSAVMEKTAARAFRAMFFSLRKELGVILKEVGDYRTFIEQLNLFLSRYKPVDFSTYNNTPSAHRKYWGAAAVYGYTSVYWIKKDFSYATAAVPGTSNHGWGLALDIAEEYDDDSAPDPIRDKVVLWIIANGDRFGICAELQSEKWHWRYYRGDAIPQAVLDYESGIVIPPDPDPTPPGGQINVVYQTIELRKGSSGPEVIRIQQIMNEVSGSGLTADGQFGSMTETAVKNWQSFFKVSGGPTGVVEAATWESFIEVWLKTGKP